DFVEFGRFLRLLKENRGQRTEVGGLPVFLVLTKCDLVARPNETPTDWIERIEDRKRDVSRRFQQFLARDNIGPRPVGSCDWPVWAQAIKHPALAGSPARPRGPFGVAELFRQGFAAARDFRQRKGRSGRRLFWTVSGTAAVVAVMAGLAG